MSSPHRKNDDLASLSFEDLRKEAERVLSEYHSSQDPKEMRSLSLRYSEIDDLIDRLSAAPAREKIGPQPAGSPLPALVPVGAEETQADGPGELTTQAGPENHPSIPEGVVFDPFALEMDSSRRSAEAEPPPPTDTCEEAINRRQNQAEGGGSISTDDLGCGKEDIDQHSNEAPGVPRRDDRDGDDDEQDDVFERSLRSLLLTLKKSAQRDTEDQAEDVAVSGTDPSVESERRDSTPKILSDESHSETPGDIPSELPPPVETAEAISALDSMPAPVSEVPVTPLPPLPSEDADTMRPAPEVTNKNERGRPSLKDALRTVLKSVGADSRAQRSVPMTPPPASPPEPPRQDRIPKSISEDLPKYRSTPRTRICRQCGCETRLVSERCTQCTAVDPSLGVLDSVIAGDVAKVAEILLVKPHAITLRTNTHDWTLLHMAASGGNPNLVELLIDKGARVNAQNTRGKTPLHYAASKGHDAIAEVLLRHHADPELKCDGKTALRFAGDAGHETTAAIIRRHLRELRG